MYLDQRDFDLFRKDFHNPSSIFLLVRRDNADDAKGAVFVWEEDDMRRHASYLEFPLPQTVPIAASSEPPKGRLQPERSAPHLSLETVAKVALTLLLPLIAFFAAREIAFRNTFRSEVAQVRPTPRPDPVPSVPGPAEEKPHPFQDTSPPTPDLVKQASAPVERPLDRVPIAADSRDRTGAPPVVSSPSRQPAPEVPALPDPPPVTPPHPAPSLPRIVASPPAAAGHPPARVVAFIKPEPASSVRLAIQKVVTGHRPDEDFIAANPVEHPLPSPPRDEVPLEQGNTIEMVAKVDRHGNVVYVKVVDGNRQLADSSANALLRWRFDPARHNGSPVDSAMRIRFEFHNPSR
jgi:hypothetical protein